MWSEDLRLWSQVIYTTSMPRIPVKTRNGRNWWCKIWLWEWYGRIKTRETWGSGMIEGSFLHGTNARTCSLGIFPRIGEKCYVGFAWSGNIRKCLVVGIAMHNKGLSRWIGKIRAQVSAIQYGRQTKPTNHHLLFSAWSQNWFSFYLNVLIETGISQAHRISVPGLLRVLTPKPGRKLTEMEL